MMNTTYVRILAALGAIACILWAPWWVLWSAAILLLFYFPVYYEILVWGVVYDALYGVSLVQFFNIPYVCTCASIILFLLSLFLKKRLSVYE